jgi:excisionase family DNA binding protein
VAKELTAREGRTGARSTEALLTVEEACAELGCGRTYGYALVASGEIPHLKVGRLLRIRPSDLAAYVAGKVTREG